MVVVLAASGRFHRAATPLEAVLANVKCAAAGAGRGAGVGAVALGGWLHRSRRGRRRRRRVSPLLDWEGWLNVDATFTTSGIGSHSLHADIALLSPAWTP